MASAFTQSDLVAVVPKSKRQEIRVSLDLLSGRRLITFRVFFEAADGSKRPGKSGISFRVDKPEEVDRLEEFVGAAFDALQLAKSRCPK
ncbi:hypothetical protein AJ88_03705 [Mesorhizobium amorphae CCBAU 01583]|nr:hypothetical protein AJ88_03705 [Mesorhizobium amorphae CCBAU 01583]